MIGKFLKFCLNDASRQRIFVFLLLNLSFTFVEIFYGWSTHSLGLIGDGVHMFFDSSVILANLIVIYLCRRKPDDTFTFGYERSEAMAGFINSLLLVYSSISILVNALERVFHSHFDIHSDNLLSVSVLGLLVNLVGLFAFGEHHTHGHAILTDAAAASTNDQDHKHTGCCSHGHDHGNSQHTEGHFIRQGMFLHVLADTLGSVAVIISSIIIKYTGWLHADTICSVLLALMILAGVKSLFLDTFKILLNTAPASLRADVPKIRAKIQKLAGVSQVDAFKCWEHSSIVYCALVKVKTVAATSKGSSPSSDTTALKQSIVEVLSKYSFKEENIFIQIDY